MKQFKKCILVQFAILIVLLIPYVSVNAAEVTYYNESTGYGAYVEDDADLITDSEERRLLEAMLPITDYGDVYFKSINHNPFLSTSDFAEKYLNQDKRKAGGESGTVFVIDMDYREIYIFSNGYIYKLVTNSKALSVTDNVYTYASAGDYYGCAESAFIQMATLLEGGRIAEPMKYTSNFFLAMIVALFICFFIALSTAKPIRTTNSDIIKAANTNINFTDSRVAFIGRTKSYSPVSKSSGGGGGGGFSGGHSGGGGGGGHRF